MGQRPRYTDTIKTGKGNGSMEYELVWVREHIEVYDGAGRFCFSADNEREVREELGLVHCRVVSAYRNTQESMKLRMRSLTPRSRAMSLQVWISSGVLSLSTMVRMTWGTYCLLSRAKSSMA